MVVISVSLERRDWFYPVLCQAGTEDNSSML